MTVREIKVAIFGNHMVILCIISRSVLLYYYQINILVLYKTILLIVLLKFIFLFSHAYFHPLFHILPHSVSFTLRAIHNMHLTQFHRTPIFDVHFLQFPVLFMHQHIYYNSLYIFCGVYM